MEKMNENTIGRFGHLREKYLHEYRKDEYLEMALQGEIPEYLKLVDDEAGHFYSQTVDALMVAHGIDDKLKASDPIKWNGLANNARACAREIVIGELIGE